MSHWSRTVVAPIRADLLLLAPVLYAVAAAGVAGWVAAARRTRKIAVIHQDARAFSLETAQAWFTGGAHPNSFKQLASFDPATGHRLQLADLLAPGFEPRLREAGERRFREVREIPEGLTLGEAGFWFENDVFSLNGNFAVAASGLAFHFDPYEVAPYALGDTDFVLRREDLGDLVRPEGPLEPPGG